MDDTLSWPCPENVNVWEYYDTLDGKYNILENDDIKVEELGTYILHT